MSRSATKKYFIGLLALLLLFCFRMAAQLIQAFYPVDFLPPFEEWHSDVMPYNLLVTCQVVVLAGCTNVVVKFARFKTTPNYKAGRFYLAAGAVYFTVILCRMIVAATLVTEIRWFNTEIPNFFHLVLASFLLVMGRFHFKYGKQIKKGEQRWKPQKRHS